MDLQTLESSQYTPSHCARCLSRLPSHAIPAGPAVYVDETLKDNTEADGTQERPYPSLLAAYTARGTSELAGQVRKAPTDEEPSPGFAPASASAVKKAKKLFDANQRKAAKSAELAQKNAAADAAKAESEVKKLEQAKSVVLEKPTEPLTAIKIKDAAEKRGQRVSVKGWVHRLRNQGGLIFVVLRDGYGFLQCVLGDKLVGHCPSPLNGPLTIHLRTFKLFVFSNRLRRTTP